MYMDNFFTSPALYTELVESQTGACGTLPTNRTGVPQAVKTADPPLGDVMSQKEGKLTGQRLLVYIQNICQMLTLLTSKWHTIPCSIAC